MVSVDSVVDKLVISLATISIVLILMMFRFVTHKLFLLHEQIKADKGQKKSLVLSTITDVVEAPPESSL